MVHGLWACCDLDLDGPLHYLLLVIRALGLKLQNCIGEAQIDLLEFAMAAEMYFAHSLRKSRGQLLTCISPMSWKNESEQMLAGS